MNTHRRNLVASYCDPTTGTAANALMMAIGAAFAEGLITHPHGRIHCPHCFLRDTGQTRIFHPLVLRLERNSAGRRLGG